MILINPRLDSKIEKCISDTDGDSHIVQEHIYTPNNVSQQIKFFKQLHLIHKLLQ